MSPQSTTFSVLAIASLLSSSIALPLDVPQIQPRLAFSIVNVDGSSSPNANSPPPTVTKTIVKTVTDLASVYISIVDVDRVFITKTVYATSTPTPTPAAPALPSTPIPYYPLHLNSTSSSSSATNSTLARGTAPLSAALLAKPCEGTPTPARDGAPWRYGYDLVPTGTRPVAYPTEYPRGSYDIPAAAKPSGITGPRPALPPTAPYRLNLTEILNVKSRLILS